MCHGIMRYIVLQYVGTVSKHRFSLIYTDGCSYEHLGGAGTKHHNMSLFHMIRHLQEGKGASPSVIPMNENNEYQRSQFGVPLKRHSGDSLQNSIFRGKDDFFR